jgi:hypothetical protein
LASTLGTEAFLPTTLSTIGTAGLGSAAQAGKLGALSVPTLRVMQAVGAFGSGTSIGQGISGKNMFTGEDLSLGDRAFNLTFGAAGAALDLGGAGFNPKNLSGSFPTVTNALEGISAPQVTRAGGQLGLSNQGGAIRLGSTPEQPPQMKLSAEPEVTVPKSKAKTEQPIPKTKRTRSNTSVKSKEEGKTANVNGRKSEEHSELTNGITNLGNDFSHHNSSVLKDFKPTLNPTKLNQTIFSGVYDPKTNTFLTKPSGNTKLSNGESPQDLVLPAGGHAQVRQMLQQANPEIDMSKTIGFTIYYREKGKLEVAFFSRGINSRNFPKLEGYAPEEYQNQFLKVLGESTGLETEAVPRLRLPD